MSDDLKRPPTFILIGAAGYVAQRHMAAIKAIGGDLIAAADPCDSVGILDSYFPKCEFFKHHLDAFEAVRSDYVVICTPNNQHAIQACQAMQAGINVILEKPATITAKHLDELHEIERITGKKVNCILNMRLHHDAILLAAISRELIGRAVVDIDYHTPRGPWYAKSWKSNPDKSGGLLFNIGVHLIDLALLVFGDEPPSVPSHWHIDSCQAFGAMHLARADVFVRLSINGQPKQRTFRVNGAEFDFTNGFEDLHAVSYRRIMAGQGYRLDDARPAIELCERITQDANSRK